MKDWWIVLRVQERSEQEGMAAQERKSRTEWKIEKQRETGEEGRCRAHGVAGGVFLKHNEPHSSKKINNTLDLLFDLLLQKVLKGPFFRQKLIKRDARMKYRCVGKPTTITAVNIDVLMD